MMKGILWIAAALLVLCACSADPTPAGGHRNLPTLTAPAQWRVSETPITLDNVTTLDYLGRLDPPDVIATWFDYALSPDSTALAALNTDQLVSWDLITGDILFYTARVDVTRLFYSPDKTELYGVTAAGRVNLYDALTGAQRGSFAGHPDFAGAVAYDANEGWLALGGNDGTIKVWDTAARQSMVTISAHTAQIGALALAPDGMRLASAGLDGAARLWDWQNRQQIEQVDAANVRRLTFAPDGSRLALGGVSAQLWTLGSGLSTLDTGGADVLLFSGDGRYLLAGGRTNGLTLWSGTTFVGRLPDTQGEEITAAFSPDGALLLTAALNRDARLWNLTAITGTTVSQAALDANARQIHRVVWTDDGRLLLLFDAVGAIYVWGAA
jgi:WD40 repeat protein